MIHDRRNSNNMSLARRSAAAKKSHRVKRAMAEARSRETAPPKANPAPNGLAVLIHREAVAAMAKSAADPGPRPKPANATPEQIAAFLRARKLKTIPRVAAGDMRSPGLLGSTSIRYPSGVPRAGW
ncbi:MAG: hypothetical protein FJ271_31315 [Planctomycetes bacterium]|nr:hypothetical protein [Planctomycetota bacterium]